jgi:prolyl-tRNA synthetase
VKFKDWDLIGIPLRLVCGRGVAEGKIEMKPRSGEASDVALADAAATAKNWIQAKLAERQAAAEAVK